MRGIFRGDLIFYAVDRGRNLVSIKEALTCGQRQHVCPLSGAGILKPLFPAQDAQGSIRPVPHWSERGEVRSSGGCRGGGHASRGFPVPRGHRESPRAGAISVLSIKSI